MTIELGRKYRDNVSGWEGIATAEYRYMNGCIRVEIAAADKDGKPEAFVFDHEQITLVADEPPVKRSSPTPTGGPRDNTPAPR